MRTILKIIGLFVAFTVLLKVTVAQSGEYIEVRDFETWTSAKVKFKPNKKLTFGLQGQLRLDKNSSELKGFFTELTGGYQLFKGMEIGAGLRYINKNDNAGAVQGNEHYFRYHLDASYKHKVDRFTIKYRFRYQNKNEIGVSAGEGDVNLQYFRLKASVTYNIKNWKLDPVLSGEIFNKYEKNGYSNGFSDYRLTIGTNYKTKNYGKIGVFYRLENEISSYYPKTTHILRIKYTYTLKR
tara:strand:+ start:36344 stop:37060 length:717 start_codon:yes stop_codon:yes gene_type:complete